MIEVGYSLPSTMLNHFLHWTESMLLNCAYVHNVSSNESGRSMHQNCVRYTMIPMNLKWWAYNYPVQCHKWSLDYGTIIYLVWCGGGECKCDHCSFCAGILGQNKTLVCLQRKPICFNIFGILSHGFLLKPQQHSSTSTLGSNLHEILCGKRNASQTKMRRET